MSSRSRRSSPNIAGSVGLENRNAAIVHAEHHGGGSALFGDAAHDRVAAPRSSKAKASHVGGTHRAQKAGGF